MPSPAEILLKPLTIKHLTLRNRVMSTSPAPGYGSDGKPKERYQLYYEEMAKSGIALTMFGGSSSVAVDSPAAPWNQISVADDSVIPFFREFSDRVRAFGIAGAPQHLQGIGGMERVIAVNTDLQAAMIKRADLAIIADAHDRLRAATAVKAGQGRLLIGPSSRRRGPGHLRMSPGTGSAAAMTIDDRPCHASVFAASSRAGRPETGCPDTGCPDAGWRLR